MQFYAELTHPLSFAKLVKMLNALLDTVNIDINEEGLHILTLDTAQVFLLEVVLRADKAFRVFKWQQQQVTTLSLKISALYKVLKRVKKYDHLVLSLANDDPDCPLTVIVNSSQGDVDKKSVYQLSQMTLLNHERIHIPDRQYPCEVLLPPQVLADACLDLYGLGQELRVEVKRGSGVSFSVENALTTAKVSLRETKGSETGILAIHTQQDHSELFAFKFFAAIAKGCASLPDCEALLLQLGPGAPLSLLCQLTNTGHLNFFLAPLIPGDD